MTEIWRPQPGKQTLALSAVVREMGVGGGRFGGKSELGRAWVSRIGIDPKYEPFSGRARGLVLRKNAKELSTWAAVAEWQWAPLGVKRKGNPVEFHFPNGYVIETGHLKDIKSVQSRQGSEYQRILVEELEHLAELDVYIGLLGSLRSTIDGVDARIMCNFNPGGPGNHWIKDRFILPAPFQKAFLDPAGQSRMFIQMLASDNPIGCAKDPEYLKYLQGLPPKLRKAWLEGSWDDIEGQFFSEFDKSIHVIEPFKIPPHWKKYCSEDWGYRPDPWVNLWFAVDEEGTEYQYRESDGNEMTPEEVAARLVYLSSDDENIVMRTADPSMWANKDGISTAERQINAKWPIVQGHNNREQGAMRIREALKINPKTGKPWLQIFKTCPKTIKAIPEMLHDEKNPMDYAPHALDHWVDPIRYHLMGRPCKSNPKNENIAWNTYEALQSRLIAQGGY